MLATTLVDRLLDAALERERVGAGRDVFRPWRTIAWASTVAVVVPSPATSVGRRGDLADRAARPGSRTDLHLDLTRDGHAIVGDRRAPNFLSRTT